jgi:ABC-type branched-subunit amino acid transport system ATPase component
MAGTLSGGQQQLAIGRALIGGPDLILLDEPSEGVQPNVVQAIGDCLIFCVSGRTMLLREPSHAETQTTPHPG